MSLQNTLPIVSEYDTNVLAAVVVSIGVLWVVVCIPWVQPWSAVPQTTHSEHP